MIHPNGAKRIHRWSERYVNLLLAFHIPVPSFLLSPKMFAFVQAPYLFANGELTDFRKLLLQLFNIAKL